ncbi:MAG: hypothetical protein HNEKOMLI_00369 [Sodalis sp. Psp]|nr:hypothetical protein [Sodalis sp. Psp]MCR3756853.1 hypothetical protein [Sodalis sp. Ppy]
MILSISRVTVLTVLAREQSNNNKVYKVVFSTIVVVDAKVS